MFMPVLTPSRHNTPALGLRVSNLQMTYLNLWRH